MNGLGTSLGRGLLVLALAGVAFGCGDDDDNAPDSGLDGGPDGGPDGGGGSGGRGGNAGADAGGVTPTFAQCVDKTSDNTQGMAPMACVECVCQRAPKESVACDATCWSLVQCYALNCADVPLDNPNQSNACAAKYCVDFLGAVEEAMDISPTIDGPCVDECVMTTPPPEDDAGVDAGD